MKDHPTDDGADPGPLAVRYTNYRGESAIRHLLPERVRFGSTDFHPQRQWLLDAVDADRNVLRTFALEDMAGVREASRIIESSTRDALAAIASLHSVYSTTTEGQTTAAALAHLWRMLGASNQTEAVTRLRNLQDTVGGD